MTFFGRGCDFLGGVEIFSGGVEIFSEGLRLYPGGLRIFSGRGGLRNIIKYLFSYTYNYICCLVNAEIKYFSLSLSLYSHCRSTFYKQM